MCAIVATLLNLTGCASPYRTTMDNEDLMNFAVDCKNKDQQLQFLRSQLPTRSEKDWAKVETGFLGPFTPNAEIKREIASGTRLWWVKSNITDIYQKCGKS